MRNLVFAVILLAGCEQKSAPPAPSAGVERVTVDPQAAARLKLRLGPNPAAVFSSQGPAPATSDDPRRAVHAAGFRANLQAPQVHQ